MAVSLFAVPTYFHVDRCGSLQAGTIEPSRYPAPGKLFDGGVSRHGTRYLHHNQRLTDVSTALELVWELVRTRCYPEKPSRYTAFYACRTLDDAIAFRSAYGQPSDSIWEIESQQPGHIGDMSLVRAGSIQAPPEENDRLGDALGFVHAYWEGHDHEGNPAFGPQLWEVLLTPPITVVRKVDEL
ncbi:DUF2441 domain-containing protein [Nocardia sp. NBC_01377]|uniref:hypothetical protein n=1 Tax=Nocardia sp. NBC_01377 TaxID=2903595 RepID=UPI0032554420